MMCPMRWHRLLRRCAAMVDLSFFTEFRFIILTHLIFGTVVRRFVNFSSWCFLPMAQRFAPFCLFVASFLLIRSVTFSLSGCLFLAHSVVCFDSVISFVLAHFGFYAFSPSFILQFHYRIVRFVSTQSIYLTWNVSRSFGLNAQII